MNATMQSIKNRARKLSKQDEARMLAMAEGNSESELIELAALAVVAVRVKRARLNTEAAVKHMEKQYRQARERLEASKLG